MRERRNKKRETALARLSLVPTLTRATPQARGFLECPCPKKCDLHGECPLCVSYHGRKNMLPLCER